MKMPAREKLRWVKALAVDLNSARITEHFRYVLRLSSFFICIFIPSLFSWEPEARFSKLLKKILGILKL